MKCKYKSWLAALAATGILAVGAAGMAEAAVTVSSDTVTMSTDDAKALNALIEKQSDLTALAAKNSELTELSGKKTGLVRAADSAVIYGENGAIQVTKDGTTLDTGWVIDRVTGSNASVVGGDTSIHTKTGVAANSWSVMQKNVLGGHQPAVIKGTNNLSLGAFTNAGYGLVPTVKQKDGKDVIYADGETPEWEFSTESNGARKNYYKYDESEQYNYATAFGVGTAAANYYATAWGFKTIAYGEAATAWGGNTHALGKYSTAFGEETRAVGQDSLAAGYKTSAVGRYSIALGYNVTATGHRAIALGTTSSKATGDTSIAIGEQTKALADYSVAIGGGTTASNKLTKKDNEELYNAKYSVAIGRSAMTKGEFASAFGYYSIANSEYSTAIAGGQTMTKVGKVLYDSSYSVAIGYESKTYAKYAVTLGNKASAWAEQSVAIGYQAKATQEYGLALGAYSLADRAKFSTAYAGSDTQPYGYDAASTADDSVWHATQSAIAVGGGKQDKRDANGNLVKENGKTVQETVTRQITGVAAGTELTDAVNVAQLKAVEKSLTEKIAGIQLTIKNNDGNIKIEDGTQTGGDTGSGSGSGSSGDTGSGTGTGSGAAGGESGGSTSGGISIDLSKDINVENTITAAGGKFHVYGDGTVTATRGVFEEVKADVINAAGGDFIVDENGMAAKKGDAKLTVTEDGIGAVKGDSALAVTEAGAALTSGTSAVSATKDGASMTAGTSSLVVADGTVAMTNGTTGLTLSDTGADFGGAKVTGVAAGELSESSTDAVNGSQLYQTNQQVAQNTVNINKLGNRIDRVGAGAAALAALHPLDFDPEAKWDFAAGYGNYRGANAAAVGAFYRPNENWMLSLGGSFGGGENMVNAGVSVKLGAGSAQTGTSKAAMAKEIKELRGTVAAQDARLAAQDERLAAQDEKIAQLTALLNSFVGEGKTPEAK